MSLIKYIVVPAFGATAMGGLWYFYRAQKLPDAHESDDYDGGSYVTYAKGLRLSHNGIKVNARQIEWAIKFRNNVSYDIVPEIVITSGIRSTDGQAAAMLQVLENGEQGFKDLYKQAATELLALPHRDVGTWGPKVKELYDRDILHKTGHYSGGSIDFRSRDLTDSQIAEFKRAAKAANARKAYIDAGPCFHVDIP